MLIWRDIFGRFLTDLVLADTGLGLTACRRFLRLAFLLVGTVLVSGVPSSVASAPPPTDYAPVSSPSSPNTEGGLKLWIMQHNGAALASPQTELTVEIGDTVAFRLEGAGSLVGQSGTIQEDEYPQTAAPLGSPRSFTDVIPYDISAVKFEVSGLYVYHGHYEDKSSSEVRVRVLPEDPDYPRDEEKTCATGCCSCGGGAAVKIGSLSIEIPVGVVPLTGADLGRLRLYSHKASAALFCPENLVFASAYGTRVLETKSNPDGSRDVTILREDGKKVTYHFPTGSTAGVPTGAQAHFYSRLVMSGGYYDRQMEDGSVIRYAVASGTMVSTSEASGRVFTPASGQFELVKVADVLRQVKTADMLADIVVIQAGLSYEVRTYPAAQVGAMDAGSGLYAVSGSPQRVFKVANPTGNVAVCNRLTFTSSAGTVSDVYEYQFNAASGTWELMQPGGLATTTRTTSKYDITGQRTIEDKQSGAGGVVSSRKAVCRLLGDDGQEVTDSETVDADGLKLVTLYTWYENAKEPGRYQRMRSVVRPDGSWAWYDYDDKGRLASEVKPDLDLPAGGPTAQARETVYSYAPVEGGDTVLATDNRPRLVTEKVRGIVTGKTWHVYKTVNGAAVEITERAASQGASYGAVGNQRTTSTYYPAGSDVFAGRLHTVESSDGSLTTYVYDRGTFSSAPDAGACTFTSSAVGDAVRTTVTRGTTTQPDGIAFKSTRSVSVMDGLGRGVMSETLVVKTDAGFERIAWTVNEFDAYEHVTKSTSSGGATASAEWSCCTKQAETTADGTQFVYAYDQMKRLLTQTKKGTGDQANVVTSYTYDADGRVLSTTIASDGLSLTTSTTYDAAGRILTSTDAAGRVTSYAYSAGGRITTVTLPGGATQVTENYIDGSVKSVTGSAVVAQYSASGVNADGTRWNRTSVAVPDSPAWSKSTTDFLGRTVKREAPGVGGSSVLVAESFYDATTGWLLKSTQPGAAATLYEYDELGNVTRSGLDVDGNNTLDLGGQDRVQEAEALYSYDNGDWWQLSTGKTYLTAGSATATITGVTKSRLTGLGTAAPEPYSGILSGETISIDLRGNSSTSRTYTDAATATVWQVVQSPDSTLPSVTKSVNGLAVSGTTNTGLTYTVQYDGLGRQTGTTDPRTGTAVTHYNAIGQVDYVQDAAGNQTKFTYHPTTGLRTIVENALGKKNYTAYDIMGRAVNTWGETGYPTEVEYDAYGRTAKLKTFRSTTADFTTITWPADPGTADVTEWIYDPATGLLLQKKYADGHGPTYTYDAANRLATRTWVQNGTATYSYSPVTGELLGVSYSDTTPAVAYSYNRIGQPLTVTDAAGTRTFTYSATTGELQSETLPAAFYGIPGTAPAEPQARILTRQYDSLGRSAGYQLLGAAPTVETAAGYTYDTYGRPEKVYPGTPISGLASLASYTYVPNANLLAAVTRPNGVTTAYAYEEHRDLITSVSHTLGAPVPSPASVISAFTYTNDPLARRTAMAKAGSAFATPDAITYTYNPRSELTSAVSANNVAYNYAYTFDPIGNRLTALESTTAKSYTSNALNQYLSIASSVQSVNAPSYDLDGNQLTLTNATGTWTFAYNAENRLISAESATQRLEFLYDYQGRRIAKKNLTGTPGSWTTAAETRFLYQGYKLIETLDAQNGNATLQKFVWTGDTPDALTDAATGQTYYYTLDANKNVSELTDNTGAIVAHYEYGPFGQTTASTGAMAAANPFRFSSEYADDEIGLVYYNFRHYDPETGSWLSKDPIEEQGGKNLYGFCGNDGIGKYDSLGLWDAVESMGGYGMLYQTPEQNADMILWQSEFNRGAYVDFPVETAQGLGTLVWHGLPPVVIYDIRTGKTQQLMSNACNAVKNYDETIKNIKKALEKELSTPRGQGKFTANIISIFAPFLNLGVVKTIARLEKIELIVDECGNVEAAVVTATVKSSEIAPSKGIPVGTVLEDGRIAGNGPGAALKGSVRNTGPVYKTSAEAAAAAKKLGAVRTRYFSDRQTVYKIGKYYITRDRTGHIGGAWKMAKTPEALGSKSTRMGTFDENLKQIGD